MSTSPKVALYANKINSTYLRSILPPDDLEVDWVRAAIAYGSDSTTLIDNCLQRSRRLDIWMRYDETVPVKPALLRKLLDNTSRNIFCMLVPDVLHAKVIWWKNYGIYIGSANLTDRAWNTNIEMGIFLPETQMDSLGITNQTEFFFEQLMVCEKAFPLDEATIKEQEAIEKLRRDALRNLDESSLKIRRVPKWEGPAFVADKNAQDKVRQNFLREWRDGLTYLRAIAERAPAYRPAWLNEDVPPAWQADQFLHAYYYNKVKSGTSYLVDEFHARHMKDPATAVTTGLEWWASLAAPPSDEDHNCHQRAPVIRSLLSRERISGLTLENFQEICKANHSTVDHVRRLSLEDLGLPADAVVEEGQYVSIFAERLWSRRNQRGEGVADLLRFVLDGGPADTLPDRLYEAAKTPQRHIAHFGTNQLAEIVGWARPEVCPPRNGRTSKGLRALGYNVMVH